MARFIVVSALSSPFGRILAGVVLLLVSPLGCAAVGGDQQPTPIPTPVAIEKPTYRVERGDVVLKESLSGSVVLVNPIPLSFKEDGKLKTLAVQVGDTVKKDAILAQLDISDNTRALNAAQFNLDQDEVKLANSRKVTEFALRKAEIDLDMKQSALDKLNATGATKYDVRIAQDAVELARIQIDELKASVDEEAQRAVARDRAVVDQLNSDVEGRTIRAPIDGVVAGLAAKVEAGAAVTAYQMVVQVGDPAHVEIAASFPPPYSDIVVGQQASVTGSRLADKTITATLRKPEGGSSNNSDQSARFSFDNSSAQLKPADTVYLSVLLKNETNVLWLAPNGIRTFMGRTFVVLREDGIEKRVDVEVGTRTSDRVVVQQGLAEGQVVIGP